MWPDRRLIELFDPNIEHPIVQAPMAGASSTEMAIAVANAGGLGSLPCAMLTADAIEAAVAKFRSSLSSPPRPINLNFFCHRSPAIDPDRERVWKKHLESYYVELGVDPNITLTAPARLPFDDAACTALEKTKPEVVSFHFGLPDASLLDRVKKTGAKILSSATTVEEARFLEDNGCDAIIAQGYEAGGHRGSFLESSSAITTSIGTFALVPRIVDAVKVPVIAAGGIGDARGIVAAFALGAAGVQIGTAYLFCAEATIAPQYRTALHAHASEASSTTAFTNVFTGRPARGIVNRIVREVGPLSELAPAFPRATNAISPLRSKSEPSGSADFMPLWSGQAASLSQRPKTTSAGDLTTELAKKALAAL